MISRVVVRRTALLLGVLLPAGVSHAQTARDSGMTVSPVIVQRVTEARAMLERGESDEARALLDSLTRTTAPGSTDLAEVLYWRATLAERAADAERAWRRIVVEVPLSPRMPDVLLRLGDLEMLRQRPKQAQRYFERVVREFPGSAQRVRAVLWLARSQLDQRDLVTGCRTFASLGRGEISEGELQLQADDLQRQCAAVPVDTAVRVVPPASSSSTSSSSDPSKGASSGGARDTVAAVAKDAGRYAVQIGAFETAQEAREMVARMKKREFDARIEGETKPFRVRIGRFAVRSEAVALQRRLKAMGIDAFVAELSR